MKARQWFGTFTDAELVDSFNQYGQQIEYHRDYPVRSLLCEMKSRGLAVKPSSKERTRPKGYDTPTGYMPFWGLQ